MAHVPRALPSPEDELNLHRRLVDGDPTSTADLAAQYLDFLVAWLEERNVRRIRQEFLVEAAEDAIISLMKSPKSFAPERNRAIHPLFAYLCMAAQRDLQNILAREKRQVGGQTSLDSVAQLPDAWKYLGNHDDPLLHLQNREELAQGNQTILEPTRNGLSDEEQQAMHLMLDGERKTAVFARTLHIEHLPTPQQRREVKRVKDKLKKRIKRGRGADGKQS